MKFTPLTICIWLATSIGLSPYLAQAKDKRFCANTAELPSVPAFAKQPQQFVPAGWKVVAKKVADLNGDHIKDVALIAESIKPWPALALNEDDQMGPNTVFYNRWLFLLKGQRSGYTLWAEDAYLLPTKYTGSNNYKDESPFIEASSKRVVFGIGFLRGGETGEFKPVTNQQWQLSRKIETDVEAGSVVVNRVIDFEKGVYFQERDSISGDIPKKELAQQHAKFQISSPLILGKDCLEDIDFQYTQEIDFMSHSTLLDE